MAQRTASGYALLDSGDGKKLERFGDVVLERPSRFALWRPQRPELWKKKHSSYDHKQGWSRGGADEWTIEINDLSFVLRLQTNGQVGLFPEHLLYHAELGRAIGESRSAGIEAPAVLNLFAYTGAASLRCARLGATVTHVDISKSALTWARKNAETSGIQNIRYIQEDATKFMVREATRGRQYQVVIADPPSFSRPSSKESWSLDEALGDLLDAIEKVLAPGGELFLCSHAYELGAEVMANLVYDRLGSAISLTSCRSLLLAEEASPRVLPSGFLVIARRQQEVVAVQSK